MKKYFGSSDMLCVDLKKYELFKTLTDQQLDQLERRMTLTRLKRNSALYRENQIIGGIYILMSGIIKIYKTGYDGKEQIIRFAKTGDPIGYRSIITGEPACTTAETLNEVTTGYIAADDLLELASNNIGFSNALLKVACKELGDSNRIIMNIAQKTVRERLAEMLLILMDTFDLDEEMRLRIALTREDLANVVGTATESVIRLLSEFRQDRVIDIQGRYIKLLNVPQLIKIANLRI